MVLYFFYAIAALAIAAALTCPLVLRNDESPNAVGFCFPSSTNDRFGCSHRRRSGLRLSSSRQAMTAFQLALFVLSIVAGLAVWLLPRLIDAIFKESRE